MALHARVAQERMRITPAPSTRELLGQAHTALWGINLRLHRGDDLFRDVIHRLRDETADLIIALDASEESDPL